MSNGIIVRPVPLTPAMLAVRTATFGVNANFPLSNVIDEQPKTVVQTNPATSGTGFSLVFDIDLGADVAIDTIAVLFTNLSVAAGTWRLFAGPASDGGFTLAPANELVATSAFGVAPATVENRRFALWTTAAPISRRYITIYLNDTRAANAEQLIRAGLVVVGQRLAPTWNFELGSGRKIDDQSTIRTLPGGETHREKGGRVPIWRATWSNMTQAEMDRLWAIMVEVGAGDPLLVIEDPDATAGQPERMHWGLLEGLDFYERAQVEKQRIDLRLREML